MRYEDEEREDFEWRDEDEEEVPEGRGGALSGMNLVGTIILLTLVVLFVGSMIFRLVAAFARFGE